MDETSSSSETDENNEKKQQPLAFRYLIDHDEIKKELELDASTFSVMKAHKNMKIRMDSFRIASIDNAQKIEDIMKRHENKKKDSFDYIDDFSLR